MIEPTVDVHQLRQRQRYTEYVTGSKRYFDTYTYYGWCFQRLYLEPCLETSFTQKPKIIDHPNRGNQPEFTHFRFPRAISVTSRAVSDQSFGNVTGIVPRSCVGQFFRLGRRPVVLAVFVNVGFINTPHCGSSGSDNRLSSWRISFSDGNDDRKYTF